LSEIHRDLAGLGIYAEQENNDGSASFSYVWSKE